MIVPEWLSTWWRGQDQRIPLPGRLTDYAALVGRYNRTLTNRFTKGAIPATINLPADTNRVGLLVTATFIPGAAAINGVMQILDASATSIWSHQVISKEADVAAVTPSPFTYKPIYLDVAHHGPMVGLNIFLLANSVIGWSVAEVLLNPSLDMAFIAPGEPVDGRNPYGR